MPRFQPLFDRVLVRPLEEKRPAGSLIVLPDIHLREHWEAEVVAIGDGEPLKSGEVQPLDVMVGDRVLLGKYAGAEISIDGESLHIVREAEILGILEEVSA